MKLFFHSVFAFIFYFPAYTFGNFDYNSNCKKAYSNVLCLKLNEARELIKLEKSKNPDNSVSISLENYIDFFSLFCSENREQFEKLKKFKDLRIARLEKESKNSPWYRYSIADIHIQWAITRFKFQENATAAFELNKAYKLLNENQRLYPAFTPNLKGLGILNVLLGSLPENYQQLLQKVGMRGNTKVGINMLLKLAELEKSSSFYFLNQESVLYLSFISTDLLKNENNNISILFLINRLPSDNLLKTYLLAKNFARNAKNDEVIKVLAVRPTGVEFEPFYHLDYMMGIAKLNKLDSTGSVYLNRFVLFYKGIYFIKDAYLKLSWYSLLNGKDSEFKKFRSLALEKGYSFSEKDKQAITECKTDDIPDTELLKARLLFDGGYFQQAESVLLIKNSFKKATHQTEYNYRMGRIYQAEAKFQKAITFYSKLIHESSGQKNYFASNSALQMGIIYEFLNKKVNATYYYELCLSMKDHEYKNSIDSQAKIGLKRLKSKN